VARAAQTAGSPLRGDGRLAALARQFRDDPNADPELIAASAQELGLIDADLALHELSAASRELLAAVCAAELVGPIKQQAPTHYGVFVHDGGLQATVLLGRRPLGFDPVPRELARGATLDIRGLLPASYDNPKLVVSGPSTTMVLPAGPGPAFELRVATHAVGAYRLELRARAGQHVRSLARLVVYAGTTPPRPGASASSANDSPGAVRRALYARTAQLRADHDLPSLTTCPQLELRAELHSHKYADAQRQAGAAREPAPAEAAPTVVRARDQDALWTSLMADGNLRARLLGSEVTQVGIGVARARDGYIVSYLLGAPSAAPVDLELAPALVLAALNQHRGTRGALALKPDSALTRVAQHAARELVDPPLRSEREVIERANAELARFELTYRRVVAVAARVADPLEAAALEPALDPGASAAGIAIAQGDATSGGAKLAVVIALGWAR
jgi:uncharacterized protein YkwD